MWNAKGAVEYEVWDPLHEHKKSQQCRDHLSVEFVVGLSFSSRVNYDFARWYCWLEHGLQLQRDPADSESEDDSDDEVIMLVFTLLGGALERPMLQYAYQMAASFSWKFA